MVMDYGNDDDNAYCRHGNRRYREDVYPEKPECESGGRHRQQTEEIGAKGNGSSSYRRRKTDNERYPS